MWPSTCPKLTESDPCTSNLSIELSNDLTVGLPEIGAGAQCLTQILVTMLKITSPIFYHPTLALHASYPCSKASETELRCPPSLDQAGYRKKNTFVAAQK